MVGSVRQQHRCGSRQSAPSLHYRRRQRTRRRLYRLCNVPEWLRM